MTRVDSETAGSEAIAFKNCKNSQIMDINIWVYNKIIIKELKIIVMYPRIKMKPQHIIGQHLKV